MGLVRRGVARLTVATVTASAVVLLAGMAVTASARVASAKPRVETRFTLLEVRTSSRRVGNGFVSRGKLFVPGTDDLVGHDIVAGRPCPSGRCFKIRALVHINGEGDLKIRGKVRRGAGSRANRRFLIIGGTGEFNGAAGKLIVSSLGGRRTLLHFDFVQ
jgi:hypothetical protein